MLWTRVRRVCLAPLLGAVLISTTAAGCDDSSADPSPLPTKSTSSTLTPTPTDEPSPPELPDEAKGTSAAAAKAFARHYIDTVNYAARTGDTEALSALSAKACSTCNAIVRRIDDFYDKDGKLVGDGWEAFVVQVVNQSEDTALVSAGIIVHPQTSYKNAKAEPKTSKETRGNLDFHLSRKSEKWVLERLDATQ